MHLADSFRWRIDQKDDMRLGSLFAALSLAAASFSSHAAVISGPLYFGGHTYYLLAENTWTASQAQAVAMGGNLATINSLEEQRALYNAFSNFGGVAAHLWIGLNDADEEGNYTWVSGETSSFTFWHPTEPNAHFPDEDYVMMLYSGFSTEGRWNDARDDALPFGPGYGPARGIVEINRGAVPEPASLALVLAAGVAAAGLTRRRKPQPAA